MTHVVGDVLASTPCEFLRLLQTWSNSPTEFAGRLSNGTEKSDNPTWTIAVSPAKDGARHSYDIWFGANTKSLALGKYKLYGLLAGANAGPLEDVAGTSGGLGTTEAAAILAAALALDPGGLEIVPARAKLGLKLTRKEFAGESAAFPPVGVRIIPRTAKKGVDWINVELAPGAENAVTIHVKRESRDHHPWYNKGHDKKYAFSFLDKPREGYTGTAGAILRTNEQGLKFMMKNGESYYFEAYDVPKDHPFHFTKSDTGGKKALLADRKSKTAHKGGVELLVYTPIGASGASYYYQCAHHEKMGGPVLTVNASLRVMFADNISGAYVAHNDSAGGFVTVASDGSECPHNTVEDAVAHLGLKFAPQFLVGASITGSNGGDGDLVVASISREDGVGNDAYDGHTPAVLIRGDGSLACNHVHTVDALRQWLTSDKPHASAQMCPSQACI